MTPSRTLERLNTLRARGFLVYVYSTNDVAGWAAEVHNTELESDGTSLGLMLAGDTIAAAVDRLWSECKDLYPPLQKRKRAA